MKPKEPQTDNEFVDAVKAWRTEPISCTCEVSLSATAYCDKPTSYAYPSMGCGWMALCETHAQKHLPHGAIPVDELITKGETWR